LGLLRRKVRIQADLEDPLADRLEEFMKVYKTMTVNKAIHDLLEIGLNAVANIGHVDTPDKVLELEKQFQEGSIVEYFEKLDRKQFDVLWSILLNENEVRYGIKAQEIRKLYGNEEQQQV
jgi:hypothetical protein